MDIGSLLLLLALIIAVAAFVASPLRVRRGSYGLRQEDHEISELLAERERVLEAIEELELDNAMGKVPEELYPIQRDALVKRGADVLRLLDERTQTPVGAEVEAVVAKVQDDPLEALIAARRERQAVASGSSNHKAKAKFCPSCGSKVQADDQFCTSCGTKL